MEAKPDFWRQCSSCKKPIAFTTKYWVCSVSTCNQKRTGWVFCSVDCWDAHVPKMNHRECWAEERHSTSKGQQEQSKSEVVSKPRASAPAASTPKPAGVTVIRRPKSS